MSVKLVWRVDPVPTGRFRSFQRRGWPSADYADGSPAFMLSSDDEYVPAKVRAGDHKPLELRVADYREASLEKHGGWRWARLKARPATLDEAKRLAEEFLKAHPEFMPAALRPAPTEAADGAAPPAPAP